MYEWSGDDIDNPDMMKGKDDEILSDDIWKPEAVVLGPGGVKGYLELGALLRLEECHGFFDNVTHYTGCSIGSAIALLMVAGYKSMEIIEIVIGMDVLNELYDGINIEEIKSNRGLLKNKTMEQKLTMLIRKKYGKVLTLGELYYASSKILTVVATNTNKERVEYLNKDTDPHLSCVQAVMMSSAMPFVIQKRWHNGCTYSDGALGNPYPIDIHDDGNTNVLGIYIDGRPDDTSHRKTWTQEIGFNIHFAMTAHRQRIIKTSTDKCRHIGLKSTVVDSIGLTVTMADKSMMINNGFSTANVFLARLKDPDRFNVLLGNDDEIPMVDGSPLDDMKTVKSGTDGTGWGTERDGIGGVKEYRPDSVLSDDKIFIIDSLIDGKDIEYHDIECTDPNVDIDSDNELDEIYVPVDDNIRSALS